MYSSSRMEARLIRECFRRLRKHFRRMRYQRLVDLLGLCSTNHFVSDLGGGRASFFAEQFPQPERIVLLDISYQFALQAKHHRPGIHIVVGDGERLPLADH